MLCCWGTLPHHYYEVGEDESEGERGCVLLLGQGRG